MIYLAIANVCFLSFMVHRLLSKNIPQWKWKEMSAFLVNVCFWNVFDFSYVGISSFSIALVSLAPLLPSFEFVEENIFFVDPQDFVLESFYEEDLRKVA